MKRLFLIVLLAAAVFLTIAPLVSAGSRDTIIRFRNFTSTSTQAKSLENALKWDGRFVLNNYSGTFALDLSYDGQVTWVNRTTVSTGVSAFNIRSSGGELATDIRVVATDSYTNYTGTETPFTHVNPGANVNIIVYQERD